MSIQAAHKILRPQAILVAKNVQFWDRQSFIQITTLLGICDSAYAWLGKRGIVQTILEDYRGHDIEAETQEIQQFLNGDNEEGLSC